jgi:hypothetical protein
MLRAILHSIVLFGGFLGFALAENQTAVSKDITNKNAKEAKITKVDEKNGTATVKIKSDGKEVEKTFKLAKDIEYTDCKGKTAAADTFHPGDMVLLVESDGEITKMKKNEKEATITKLDAKKGSATVKMQHEGKDVEKTFKLADEIEYMDSTGKVANVEIFTLGDLVLYVESEGQITKLKKCDKPEATTKPKGNK